MASASDNFDRADSGTLGANWAADVGVWEIRTNTAAQDTTANAYYKVRYTGTVPGTGDYYSEAVIRVPADIGGGTLVRGTASSANTYYTFILFGGDAGYLIEVTAGGETILDTGSSVTSGTNYTVRTIANGTTISGNRNGAEEVSATDASLSGGHWGMSAFGGVDTGTTLAYNDWAGADLSAPAVEAGYMSTIAGYWGV